MATQIDLGAVVPIGKGDWDIGTTYERANIVRHNSVAWICKVESSTGVEPTEDSSDWYLLVKDTSSVTSVNGQRGDVSLDIISPSQVDNKINTEINDVKSEINSKIPSVMVGASDEISGKSGIVPAPQAGEQNKAFFGDGKYYNVVRSVGGSTPDANGNVNAPYLPLTGGAITGNLRSSYNNKLTGCIRSDINTYFLSAITDSGNNGSSIILRTDRYTINPNGIELFTGNNFTGPVFQLTQNGNCVWNGKQIVRSVNGIGADANGNVNVTSVTNTGFGPNYHLALNDDHYNFNFYIRTPAWGTTWFVVGYAALQAASSYNWSQTFFRYAGPSVDVVNITANGGLRWPNPHWTDQNICCFRVA